MEQYIEYIYYQTDSKRKTQSDSSLCDCPFLLIRHAGSANKGAAGATCAGHTGLEAH